MLNYISPGRKKHTQEPRRTRAKDNNCSNAVSGRYKRLAIIGRKSAGIISELCSPIDATNRFINLTLQTVEENSQGREFLLESKRGIRKTSHLLRKLHNYARQIEREIDEISRGGE